MHNYFIDGMKLAFGGQGAWPVRDIVFVDSANELEIVAFVKRLEAFDKAVVVADEKTFFSLGQKVARAIGAESVVLGGKVKADGEAVQQIIERVGSDKFLIAVGSGTINDLCKYASHKIGTGYAVFPTAASMNGYTSANASISFNGGIKSSHAAHLPKGIFVDFDVIAKAPTRLTASGFGDFACRGTVQTDWLLSHLLLGTYCDEAPFQMVKKIERKLFQSPGKLAENDVEAIKLLFYGLLLGGFGMYLCKGSYPASQGEHMIAHALEMAFPEKCEELLHGEVVAVASVYMAKCQQKICSHNEINLSSGYIPKDRLSAMFGKNQLEGFIVEYNKKILVENSAEVDEKWEQASSKIAEVKVSCEVLEVALKAASAPVKPEDIGISTDEFLCVADLAKYTRNRFTFLDI